MKKFLVALLSLMMVLSLTACSGGKSDNESSGGESSESEKTAYSFKVWCADNIVDLTKSQLEAFAAEHADEYDLTFTVEAVGEGDAATSMITDVEAGADVFCFAQDQLARLVQSNALAKPGQKAAETIKSDNDSGAVLAASFSGELYAYPLTSDNGYFMYYDKTVVSEDHLDDLTAVLADCVAAGKFFSFNGTSAWYNAAFFFGTGCVSEWEMNGTDIVNYTDTYNTDAGLVAIKGLSELVTSSAYNDSASAADFNSNSAVVVTGTWDYTTAVEALGDNLGVTDLPSFTVDGTAYHMGSFGGNKLVGVKPQTDATKGAIASQIALWLTNEANQLQRFQEVAWGPSNKVAASSSEVASNPALAAFAMQNDYAVPQGQYPGQWWDIGGAIGSATLALGANPSDDDLKGVLQSYADSLSALLTVDPAEARKWTVIGSVLGTSWDTDFEMTEDPANTWSAELELHAGEEFKVRRGANWDFNLGSDGPGGANFTVDEDGTYVVTLVMDSDDAWESGTVTVEKK